MAKTRPRLRGMLEWIGGLGAMPGYIDDGGEPYRPTVLFWIDARGAVLGSSVGKPLEILDIAAASLQSAIEQPMIGRPHAPSRVRVASAELAEVLRAAHPSIEIVCAPTPEVDELLALMRERFAAQDDVEPSYLASGIDAAVIGSFFRAAAELFRAAPWRVVPSDEDLFAVTIDALALNEAAMSVIGQMGENFGLVIFSGFDDFAAFVDAVDVIERGETPVMPRHVSLNFGRGAEIGTSLRKEIAEHRWVVAGADAYPLLVAADEDLIARPPTSRELAIAEGVALALLEVLREKDALVRAWAGGEPVARTVSVRTHVGDVDVMLRAPYERLPTRERPLVGVLAELAALVDSDALADGGEEIDFDARRALEEQLVDAFAASPEAQALTESVGSCRLVMDFAASRFGITIATLGAAQLREIVFELIPRKVSMAVAEARELVEENRAFYAFLRGAYQLAQADACLRVLAGDAVKKLEHALGDPRMFGLGKSLLMGGHDAGFDMDSVDGVEAWLHEVQSRGMPELAGAGAAGSVARPRGGAGARKKSARKKGGKARKKKR